jgi:pilus assembly protein CpaF
VEAPALSEEAAAWAEWNATVAVILEALESEEAPVTWEGAGQRAESIVAAAIASGHIAEDVERDALVQDAVAEYVGIGPLGDLLADDEVDRIVVTGPELIRVWRAGEAESYGRVFAGHHSLDRAIDRLAAEAGVDPDAADAVVDGTLAGGSAFHAVRAPLSSNGATLVIRRPQRVARVLADIADGAAVAAIRAAVQDGRNVLVLGRPGTGRTAALSALTTLADPDERLVVVESGHQLLAPQADVVRLARDADGHDGSCWDEVLRLSPDRIVVDDVDATNVLEYVSVALTAGVPVWASARGADAARALDGLAAALELSSQAALGERSADLIARAVGVVIVLDDAGRGAPRVTRVAEVTVGESGLSLRAPTKR